MRKECQVEIRSIHVIPQQDCRKLGRVEVPRLNNLNKKILNLINWKKENPNSKCHHNKDCYPYSYNLKFR